MSEDFNEKFVTFLNEILENVFVIQFGISIVGLGMNIPHLFILLHNLMRTSSTNSIMIGIALCDLSVLSENVFERVNTYWLKPPNDPCVNDGTYLYQLSLLIGVALYDTCERASFWLGVFLALTRLLIMKVPGNPRILSRPLSGYFLILALTVLSFAHSLYYYYGYRIKLWANPWKPGKTCTGFSANYSEQTFIRYFEDNDRLFEIGGNYIFINGLSRILVSILYPILALLLFYEIRKSAKFASEALSKQTSKERNRTGHMILTMTVFYIIASAPAGTSDFIQLFVEINPNSILETIVGYGSIFLSALFCFNAASHGFINFTMSSKYRDTVKIVLGLKKRREDTRVFSITKSVEIAFKVQFGLAIIGALLIIPHIIILTRNSMRTSSTNSLLIGIAVFDFLVLIIIIHEKSYQYWLAPSDDICINRDTYVYTMTRWIGDFLKDSSERSSFWSGLILALIRVIIMKGSGDFKNLSKTQIGYLFGLLVFIANSIFSGYNYYKYNMFLFGYWEPDKSCHGFSENYSEPVYYTLIREGHDMSDFYEKYNCIDGISRIIIAMVYPVLAMILFFEICRSAKFASAALSKRESMERLRPARMILVMTIFYIIASLPIAVFDFIELFGNVEIDSMLEMLIGSSHAFISILFCVNAMSQSVINYKMSLNYRNTVKSVMGLENRKPSRKLTVVK